MANKVKVKLPKSSKRILLERVNKSCSKGEVLYSPRITFTHLNRAEELKKMNNYRKTVTKSPESAEAFLKRIGAFDIK